MPLGTTTSTGLEKRYTFHVPRFKINSNRFHILSYQYITFIFLDQYFAVFKSNIIIIIITIDKHPCDIYKISGRQLPDWSEGFIHRSRRKHCPLCRRPMGVPPCLNSPLIAMFVVPCYLLKYMYIRYTHRSLIIRGRAHIT